jgi:hypothetical protein
MMSSASLVPADVLKSCAVTEEEVSVVAVALA